MSNDYYSGQSASLSFVLHCSSEGKSTATAKVALTKGRGGTNPRLAGLKHGELILIDLAVCFVHSHRLRDPPAALTVPLLSC